MAENNKGRVKITVEVEVNEPLMDVVKDAISNMSTSLPDMMRRGEKK